jgi:hypothetical protein
MPLHTLPIHLHVPNSVNYGKHTKKCLADPTPVNSSDSSGSIRYVFQKLPSIHAQARQSQTTQLVVVRAAARATAIMAHNHHADMLLELVLKMVVLATHKHS